VQPHIKKWRAREALTVKHDVYVNEEVIHIITTYPARDFLVIMFFDFCACWSTHWQGIDMPYMRSYYLKNTQN
jgi:hypothetical protein